MGLKNNNSLFRSFRKLVRLSLLFTFSAIIFAACHKRDNSKIPTIFLKTNSDILWDNYSPCIVGLSNNFDTLFFDGKIKCRGGISSKYYKHSYSLKFTEPHSVCGLPTNKSWILNASYIDKTFMRHKICYDLFRMMGDYNAAPQCSYAFVYENSKPLGLYVVMQRLNKQVLKVSTIDSCAVIFKEPKIFYPDSLMPKRESTNRNYHDQTYPNFSETTDYSIVMDNFRNFILNSSDNDFYENIRQWIDLRNLIDWHLLLLFTNGGDGVLKNFYFYKTDSETPFRVALWDCDHSLGRDGDNELNMLKHSANCERNILLNRLMKYQNYRKSLKRRYWQLRENGIFSYKTIEKMVKENDTSIKKGIVENERLWPSDGDFYYDNNNYEQEKELLLHFVTINIEKLDKEFQD